MMKAGACDTGHVPRSATAISLCSSHSETNRITESRLSASIFLTFSHPTNIVGFVGAIGVSVPVGATYIYNLNFFRGFIVAAGTYYLLFWVSPIPACSEKWMEVGDEICSVSVASGADGDMYEDDSGSRDGPSGYGGKGGEESAVRERKVIPNIKESAWSRRRSSISREL